MDNMNSRTFGGRGGVVGPVGQRGKNKGIMGGTFLIPSRGYAGGGRGRLGGGARLRGYQQLAATDMDIFQGRSTSLSGSGLSMM